MIRSKFVLVASVLMLMFIGACNKDEASEEIIEPSPVIVKKKVKVKPSPGEKAVKNKAAAPNANKAKPKAAAPAAAGAASTKQTLAKLNGYLPAAVKALQADDVEKAQQYVQDFSANWKLKGIQAAVKKQSPASFDKISKSLTNVNNAMTAATPDKAQATKAIQSLSEAVTEYAQGT
ncbi:MAG: hypothetical protein ABI417_07410 [Coleofasciculaceae cyanobacterium]